MERNSFERLIDNDALEFQQPLQSIAHKVTSELSLFQYIGNIFDLYLPKVVNTLLRSTSTQDQSEPSNSGNGHSRFHAPHWQQGPGRNGNRGPLRGM